MICIYSLTIIKHVEIILDEKGNNRTSFNIWMWFEIRISWKKCIHVKCYSGFGDSQFELRGKNWPRIKILESLSWEIKKCQQQNLVDVWLALEHFRHSKKHSSCLLAESGHDHVAPGTIVIYFYLVNFVSLNLQIEFRFHLITSQ